MMAAENSNGFAGHTPAVTALGVATASAYSAYDAFGSQWSAEYAAGRGGSWLQSINVFDRGTANAWLRFHFFSTGFSASPDGTPWTMEGSDFANYLGYADVLASDWVSAGATANMASVRVNPVLPLYSLAGNRMVWGQIQTPGTPTAGALANAITFTLGVMYD
jgi:hypothetical protein